MRLSCASELRKPHGVARCEIEAPLPPGSGVDAIGNVCGEIELANVGTHIRAQGRLRAVVRVECNRCLKPLLTEVNAEVDEECSLKQVDQPSAYEVDEDGVEMMPILDGDDVDLAELIRQNVTVNVPTVPLCRPTCRGICVQCGKDLNEGPCTCRRERTDPRLSKLRELLPPDAAEQ